MKATIDANDMIYIHDMIFIHYILILKIEKN
jgi:hypothetical protein